MQHNPSTQPLRKRKRPDSSKQPVVIMYDREGRALASELPPPQTNRTSSVPQPCASHHRIYGFNFYNSIPVESLQPLNRNQQRVGSGSFGSVCAVVDESGQAMACKSQPWNQVSRNEYYLHKRLQPQGPHHTHPGIVRLLEVRTSREANESENASSSTNTTGAPKRSFLLFELAETDLLHRLHERGRDWQRFNIQLRVDMLHDVVEGLHYLHQSRILHLDLKPANLLVFGTRCKIGDLGAAHLLAPGCRAHEIRNMSVCVVTNPYRAPELMFPSIEERKRCTSISVTAATDLWSLGAIALDLFGIQAFQTSRFVQELRASTSVQETQWDNVELVADTKQWALVNSWLQPRPPPAVAVPSSTAIPGLGVHSRDVVPEQSSRLDDVLAACSTMPAGVKKLVRKLLSRDPRDRPTTGDILSRGDEYWTVYS